MSLAALVALVLVAPAAVQDDVLFPFPLYDIGSTPSGLTAGDVDLDGVQDLVGTTTVFPFDSVFVLLGRGGFVLEPAHASASGAAPTAPVLADLDGDGRLDLLTIVTGGIAVQRGQGDGDFEAPVVHAAGGVPYALVVADMDEDGAPDALSALPAEDRFALLRGNGAGGLLAATPFGVYDSPLHLATADLDLDGHQDVVTANSGFPSTLTVRLGDGHGSVGPKNTFVADDIAQFGANFVAVEDLDGDGLPDLTVNLYGGLFADLNTLRGLGGGTFAPPVSQAATGTVRGMADVDGDGRRDLVAGFSQFVSPYMVRLADGQGGYGPVIDSFAPAPPKFFAAADLDGDGALDLAATHEESRRVSVLRGSGDGHFLGVPQVPAGVGSGIGRALGLFDADLDGDTDVLALAGPPSVQAGDDLVSVLRWEAGDLLAPLPSVFDTELTTVVYAAAFGDLDGDGAADALVAMRNNSLPAGLLRPLLSDGSGHFVAGVDTPAPSKVERVALGDIDGDSDLDAVANESLGSGTLVTRLNDGSGTFTAGTDLFFTHSTSALLLHDLDLDGCADLVWMTSQCCSTFSQVRLADGAGGFGPPLFLPGSIPNQPNTVVAGDVDADGLPDLCRTTFLGLETFLGTGTGTFTSPLTQWDVDNSHFGALADLDLDGDLDASLMGPVAGHTAARGDGTGAFALAGSYHAILPHAGPRVGDLDADGLPEVVLLGGFSDLAIARAEHVLPGPWADLGHALSGSGGPPRLQGHGPLIGGEPITLKIGDAKPAAFAVLVLGPAAINAPFKGGTLVPVPALLVVGLPLDAFGHFVGSGPWYAGLPPGTQTFFQAWIADPSGPQGFAATNALRATSP